MVLPTRGQRDWDDELNNELSRLDGDVQSAKADATSAKSTAISAQSNAAAAANSAAQSASSAQVAADAANKPTADVVDAVLADTNSAASQRLSDTYARKAEAISGRVAHILADTSATASRVAVERRSATDYRLWQELGDGYWWRARLTRGDTFPTPVPGGAQVHQLYKSDVVNTSLTSVNQDAAGVATTGTGWTSTTQAAAYGGNYTRSNVAGDAITYTTPAGVTKVGLHSMIVVNAGVARVTIDDGAEVANRLLTAQEFVDYGILPSSVLVANGGTLNPSDRLLNQYEYGAPTNYNNPVMLADGLFPGAHTVKVEVTGYKQSLASDTRVYVGGFAYATDGATPASPVTGQSFITASIVPRDSAWEYAHRVKPSGASAFVFVGNFHGYETQDSLTFTVDGATVTLNDGDMKLGRKVQVSRTTRLHHSEQTTTDVANVTTTYTVTGNGLRVQHQTTWAKAGEVNSSYPVMFPTNKDLFRRAMIDTQDTDYILGADDGGAEGYQQGNLVGAWLPYGDLAAMVYIPDIAATVNGWADDGDTLGMFAEDRTRSGGISLSKLYVTRVSGAAIPVAASEVWSSDALYRVALIDRGADAAMSSTV